MISAFYPGITAFGAYIAATLLLLRVRGEFSAAALVMLTAVVFYIAGIALNLSIGHALNFWHYTAAYWFPSLAFLMIFGALYKSVSLRMLAYLLEQTGRSTSYDILLRKYVAYESFEHRLDVILEGGFASHSTEGYALTEKGRFIARVVRCLHVVFAIDKIG